MVCTETATSLLLLVDPIDQKTFSHLVRAGLLIRMRSVFLCPRRLTILRCMDDGTSVLLLLLLMSSMSSSLYQFIQLGIVLYYKRCVGSVHYWCAV